MRKPNDLKSLATRSVIVIGAATFWLTLLFVFVGVSGCISPAEPPDDTTEKNPPPPPVIVSPDDSPEVRDITLAVSAEDSLVATLYELLGDAGSLTIDPSAPIVVRRPEATLTIAPGTRLDYELGPSGGSITFADPRPTVSVKKWGLKLSPRLARLDLSTDNTGTAHVQSGPLKFARRFSLGWAETDSAGNPPAIATAQPVVRMFTATWCGPCRSAHAAIDAAASTLPFRVEYVPEPHPFPARLPYFEWVDQSGNRWGIEGWPGLDSLVRRWRVTQPDPRGPDVSQAGQVWTFPGSTHAELVHHLTTHPNHRDTFATADLSAFPFDSLVALHSDHHNQFPVRVAVTR
jgi:thiol-disulfide isomerase/thioredoxin